jgi:hypothetical protein
MDIIESIGSIFGGITEGAKKKFAPSASLWQFFVAALALYLIMEYVDGGITLGLLILFLVILETPDAAKAFSSLLGFIQAPLAPQAQG